MERFQFKPLESDRSIRIATLHPGSFDDEIKITLSHANLQNEDNSYEALSYVWGNPKETQPISCENTTFDVTTNLSRALRYLREESQPRKLWIDAICINQNDILERNQQVSLMKAIYSSAVEVVIWTGEDDPSAEGAYGMVQFMVSALRSNPDAFDYNSATRRRIRDSINGQEEFKALARSALAFLENEWFYRVWTFQEVFLSRKAKVVCGKYSFHWELFACVWQLLDVIGLKLNRNPSAITVIATFLWDREMRFNESQTKERVIRLSNLVRSTYRHFASDPRDKIFALIAMVESRNGVQFVPDYSLSVEEVYIQYARLMIQDDGHLQILSDVDRRDSDLSLPSWVPDWRQTRRGVPFAERTRDYAQKYHLHGQFNPQIVIGQNSDLRKLQLRGACVGKIIRLWPLRDFMDEVDPEVVLAGRWQSALRRYKFFFEILSQLVFNFPKIYAHSGESCYSAFVKTLAADDLPNSHRGSESDSKQLFPWYYDMSTLTWEQSIAPLPFDPHAMNDSSYRDKVGGPVHEVFDFLLDRGTPTKWATEYFSLDRIRVEDIYCHLTREIVRKIYSIARQRVFFVTENGYMGIGSRAIDAGDLVYDLLGGDIPYILRSTAASNEFKLLGDAYVHGIMDGELWRLAGDGTRLESVHGDLAWQDVVLV
jgi:hypothetical protein